MKMEKLNLMFLGLSPTFLLRPLSLSKRAELTRGLLLRPLSPGGISCITWQTLVFHLAMDSTLQHNLCRRTQVIPLFETSPEFESLWLYSERVVISTLQ